MKKNTLLISDQGVSLIEMVIMSAIIAIFALIVISGYPRFNKGVYVKKEAETLALNLRLAQNYAIAGNVAPSGFTPKFWGLYVTNGSNQYIIFGDVDGDRRYDSQVDETIDTVRMENGVTVTNLYSSVDGGENPTALHITFKVPFGDTQINDGSSPTNSGSFGTITLTPAGATISKKVTARLSGQIVITN